MSYISLAARILLLALFIGAGASRIVGTQQQVMEFAVYGYPDWMRIVSGVIQVASVLLLWYRKTRLLGAIAAAMIIVGTMYTYWRFDDAKALIHPAAWLVVLILAIWPAFGNNGQ